MDIRKFVNTREQDIAILRQKTGGVQGIRKPQERSSLKVN
jgi:hypothetical protein